MSNVQALLQRGLTALDPWLDASFPVATTLICTQHRLAGYSVLVLYLMLRLLQRSDQEQWRWILIGLLVMNAGLIIEDRDFKPGGPSDYLIMALGFAAGFQRNRQHWRRSLTLIASCIIPLLALSLAAGNKFIDLNTSFTGFNINRIGFLAGILAVFSYSALLESKSLVGRITSATFLTASAFEAILTQSRAAIALPIAAIAADQLSRIHWTKKKLALISLVTTSALILTLYTWYSNPSNNNTIGDANRISTIKCWVSKTSESTNTFILGQGYGKLARKKCGPDSGTHLSKRDAPLAHSHNLYVQLFGETGALGLILGASLTAKALSVAWQSTHPIYFRLALLRPLTVYLFLMALGDTWQSMLLNQVLVGYSLSALSEVDHDVASGDAAIPEAQPTSDEQPW